MVSRNNFSIHDTKISQSQALMNSSLSKVDRTIILNKDTNFKDIKLIKEYLQHINYILDDLHLKNNFTKKVILRYIL